MLDDRKYLILQAIIDDYITTAMPVGSRTISRKAGVGYSPATIRNEMSDLEELGYLDQPHTSAGRIPSVKAYRLYVDHLMKAARLPNTEAEELHEHLNNVSKQVEGVIRTAANVLADATNYTSVVTAPRLSTLRIKHVQLVPVAEKTALLVIVTNAGIVRDAVVHFPEGMDADQLYEVSRMLTQRLAEKPMDAVRQSFAEMFRDAEINRRLLGEILSVIEEKVEAEDSTDYAVGGAANMLAYPEYSDVDKAKRFLSALESRRTIRSLIARDGSMEVRIRIGPENGVPEMSDCTVVTARYNVGSDTGGTLAIIGPVRMNYTRVISVLDFMGRALSEVLADRK